jgi:hypothetical protein
LCPPEFTRKPWQRRALHLEYLLSELLYPIARRTLPYRPKMWWIPRLPMWLHPTRRPHTIPWTANIPPPPDVLRTVPGIGLIPDLQEQAFQREPLHDFTRLHPGMRSISSPTGRIPTTTNPLKRMEIIKRLAKIRMPFTGSRYSR